MFDRSLTKLIPELQDDPSEDKAAHLTITIYEPWRLTAEHLIDLERYLEENIGWDDVFKSGLGCPIDVEANNQ